MGNVKLTDLLDLSGGELDRLYESAATPDVTAIAGDYEGLLLEGHLPGIVAAVEAGRDGRVPALR